MDAETEAAIATLRSEIASLRAEIAAVANEMAGGDGADVGLPITPLGGADYGAFRWEDGKITNCYFMVGRHVQYIDDVQDATADGIWSLVIPHASAGQPSVVLNASQTTDLTQTVIPLFEVEGGRVTRDWRGMPVVPLRE